MINKFTFGKPFNTEAVVFLPQDSRTFTDDSKNFPKGKISIDSSATQNSNGSKKSFELEIQLTQKTMIFGLGQNMGGINKRGKIYNCWCTDEFSHTEEKTSLYGAHPFIILYEPDTKDAYGLFFDYPGLLQIDAGFTSHNILKVTAQEPHIALYYIEGNSLSHISHQFRTMIGKSYVPPEWALGYMQSRWGYGSEADLYRVYDNYKKAGIPLDALFLDIDYMDSFRDFSVNKNNFTDFAKTVADFKKKHIHIVPIIDAGIKVENADPDKEGLEKDFFCKKADGTPFAAGVWPGLSHFTDFLNPKARTWFGSLYKTLTDAGIDGFWNDMNEPALFYSEDGLKAAHNKIRKLIDNSNPGVYDTWELKDTVLSVQNSMEDYKSFFHKVPLENAGGLAENVENGVATVNHAKVHNLYGYNMTRAASEFFTQNVKDPVLLFSRASYIGAHRYGGIWTGDNAAWWAHIEVLLHQLPGLNMCGFLYTGCDIGGFGCNTTRELLLRFLGIGIWTPLMRNHSALGTREQECYQFEDSEDFRGLISLRYRLLPYLYEQLKTASEKGSMYFKPLAFDFADDEIALRIEDQLLLGDDLMIAPVYTQNATGRHVYLPENMKMVRCTLGYGLDKGTPQIQELSKGSHYIKYAPNEVVFFLRGGRSIWVVDSAQTSAELDIKTKQFWK